MDHTYRARNRRELIDIFNEHHRPIEVKSSVGSYVPYDTDSENDIFDEAMFMFCNGAKIVTVVY